MGTATSREEEDPELSAKWTADGIQRTFNHGSLLELDEALFQAVGDGDLESTEALLREGANINHLSQDHEWQSPILVAAQEGSLECLRILLAHKDIVDTLDRPDTYGFTACHLAAHWGHSACLHALLEAGAQPSRLAKGAGTAAHVAASRDNHECLRVCHSMGVNLGVVDADGRSVYDVAVEGGSHRCVALLEAWDDLHQRPEGPSTTLRIAPADGEAAEQGEALRPAQDAAV